MTTEQLKTNISYNTQPENRQTLRTKIGVYTKKPPIQHATRDNSKCGH